jgi:hypothetical protein
MIYDELKLFREYDSYIFVCTLVLSFVDSGKQWLG